jgi:serine/threonine-protein kinase haspin
MGLRAIDQVITQGSRIFTVSAETNTWINWRKKFNKPFPPPFRRTLDNYTSSQLYCIILLPYGGIDLEHCTLTNWRQAWTVLTQVAASLESKEQAPFWFEHRDLHWGNILVKSSQQKQIAFPRRHIQHQQQLLPRSQGDDSQLFRSVPTFGIVVQMIDFTLARVQGGNLF